MRDFISRKKITLLLSSFLFIILLSNIFVVYKLVFADPLDRDIQEVNAGIASMDMNALDEYFTSLAQEEGALVAYDVLRKVTLPVGFDAHVVAHSIGSMLYKQQGVKGMRFCTDEFNNACSHAIVIEHFKKSGEGVIKEIAKQCEHVPGGKQGYTMCFHGLGHGVFAYFDYTFEKTIPICRKAGKETSGVEFRECVGGAVMESISGGLHSKDIWNQNTKKYFSTENPLSPCSTAVIPSDAKSFCYIYLTPHLFNIAGFAVGKLPTDNQLKKAFSYCENVSEDSLRQSCYEGFGKELVSMANDWNSDIEGKSGFGPDKIKRASHYCQLGTTLEAKQICITSSASVLYWGGIKDPKYVNEFCKTQSGDERYLCYSRFLELVKYFNQNKKQACSLMPPEWEERCSKS